ncbi:hypothetical protein C8R47DRAFT_1082757, partial [Mycena vitilis]
MRGVCREKEAPAARWWEGAGSDKSGEGYERDTGENPGGEPEGREGSGGEGGKGADVIWRCGYSQSIYYSYGSDGYDDWRRTANTVEGASSPLHGPQIINSDTRLRHLEAARAQARERMARLRAVQTEEQRQKHRDAQKRYRERFGEQIAHRARRAAGQKNLEAGKETKRRPKARQYWSDPELASASEEEEEEDDNCVSTSTMPCEKTRKAGKVGSPSLDFSTIPGNLSATFAARGSRTPPHKASGPQPPQQSSGPKVRARRRRSLMSSSQLARLCGAMATERMVAMAWEHAENWGITKRDCHQHQSRRTKSSFVNAARPEKILVALDGTASTLAPVDGKGARLAASSREKVAVLIVPFAYDAGVFRLRLATDLAARIRGAATMVFSAKPMVFSAKPYVQARESPTMSSPPTTPSRKPRLVPTNLKADEVIMDDRGVKDPRYYCLPPFHGSSTVPRKGGGGYPFHLVTQGHRVGTFDNWVEAQASLTGYPHSGNRGFNSVPECVDAWQGLCVLGIHPHPVDPLFMRPPSPGATIFVNSTPRRSTHRREPSRSPIKAEQQDGTPRRDAGNPQLLADLPIRNEEPAAGASGSSASGSSASPQRSSERYLEMQRRGEEPDMLVTRSVLQASLFALGDEENIIALLATIETVRVVMVVCFRGQHVRENHLPRPRRRRVAMPRAGTAARKRARQGLAPVKPGSKPWVHGTKLVFFKKHKEAYLAAAELSTVGAFYDEVTHGYLGVYGYNTAWKEDLPEGATVADDVDPDEDLEELTDEESDRRNTYFRKVRG